MLAAGPIITGDEVVATTAVRAAAPSAPPRPPRPPHPRWLADRYPTSSTDYLHTDPCVDGAEAF